VSVCEHALPSLQIVPSDFAGLEHMPVAVLQVPAVWHWSGAAHVTGLAPVQMPSWQVSAWVQALASLHDAPLAFAKLQMPVPGLQEAAVWHWSGAAQITGLAPVHVPAWQVSVWVQASPSLHEEPLAFAGLEEHIPVAVLQVPAVWHWSGAGHETGLFPAHSPTWHVSVCVHALPSLHAVPSTTGGAMHVPVPALHAAMAEPQTGKRLSPLTCTGMYRSVVVLSPSWPWSFKPQAQTVPSDFSAAVCR
jgi:hypothetical protein